MRNILKKGMGRSGMMAMAALALLSNTSLTSCKNGDVEFDDYEKGTTVFFPYQTPVRTILLGEDNEVSTVLDNQHKFMIYAAQGGSYNTINATLHVEVDNSLCDNLTFEDGTPVVAMPENYYRMESNTINITANYMGGVTVDLTDDFFNDPRSISTTFVIPLVIKEQTGAGSINRGVLSAGVESAQRTDLLKWEKPAMDYTLYCVRYVNPWHGYYLVKEEGKPIDKNSKVVEVQTLSMTECKYVDADRNSYTLTFNGDDCTITDNLGNVVGTGHFGHKTELKAWGDKDRDALYLDFNGGRKDVLVAQRRGDFAGTVKEFKFVYNN